MNDDPSVRALAIAKGLVRTKRVSKKEVVGETFGGFVRLRAVVGAFYWVSLDGMRVLRGREPGGADELQGGFIEAMARAGSER
jgi:hypothetical protein